MTLDEFFYSPKPEPLDSKHYKFVIELCKDIVPVCLTSKNSSLNLRVELKDLVNSKFTKSFTIEQDYKPYFDSWKNLYVSNIAIYIKEARMLKSL